MRQNKFLESSCRSNVYFLLALQSIQTVLPPQNALTKKKKKKRGEAFFPEPKPLYVYGIFFVSHPRDDENSRDDRAFLRKRRSWNITGSVVQVIKESFTRRDILCLWATCWLYSLCSISLLFLVCLRWKQGEEINWNTMKRARHAAVLLPRVMWLSARCENGSRLSTSIRTERREDRFDAIRFHAQHFGKAPPFLPPSGDLQTWKWIVSGIF